MGTPDDSVGFPRYHESIVTAILHLRRHYCRHVAPHLPASSIAPYARVQKSVKTFGGSGESIMRWVKRMPIIPSAGSVYAVVTKPPEQTKRLGVWQIRKNSAPSRCFGVKRSEVLMGTADDSIVM